MLFLISNALPSTLLTSLLVLFRMAGVNVGHKFHHRYFLNVFRGLANRVRQAQVRKTAVAKPATQQQQHRVCNIFL